MKKTTKKLITASAITFVTLAVGFAITMASFNLFGYLSIGEMKVLFAIDVIALFFTGSVFLLFQESKANKKRKEEQYRIRRERRLEEINNELHEINLVINRSNSAA